MALTERQQQIQELLDQGKSVAEVAKKLKITTNGVYQQLRRMRATSGGEAGATPSGTGGRQSAAKPKSTARKPSSRKPAAKPATSAPAPAPERQVAQAPRSMTPLQAIKFRRDEVSAGLKEAEANVTIAERELQKATEARDRIKAKVTPELAMLDAAESALRGTSAEQEPPAPEPVPTPEPETPAPVAETPAEPTPEPVPTPEAEAPAKPAAKPASSAKPTGKKGGNANANGKGDAASTPKPTSQGEREATADPFEEGGGEDIAAKAEAEAAQAAAEATAA